MAESSKRMLFEKIFEAHVREIMRYIGFKVADTEVVDDIAASCFLKVWEIMQRQDEIRNSRALLYRIAHGLIVDHYRYSGKRAAVPMEDDAQLPDSVEEIDVEALDRRNEYKHALSLVALLKQEYREVVLLHYVENLSILEIADMLQESEGNVRVRLHRALTKLQEARKFA